MRKTFKIGVVLALLFAAGYIFFVSSENRALAKFRTAFMNAATQYRREVFEEHFDKLGARPMLMVLEEEFSLCHSQAHDLGRVLFAQTKDFVASIEICRDGCTGGCFHGVLMEAFGALKENSSKEEHIWAEDVVTKMNDVCNDSSVLAIHRKGKCVHGIGHVLSFLTNYDIQKSLDLCARFEDTPLEFYCAGGVFMEYSAGVKDARDRAPHYPCDTFTKFPGACYPFVMEKLVRALGSRDAVEKECLALYGFMRAGCFRGFGILYNVDIESNPQLISRACRSGTLADQKVCIEGAIIKLTEVDEEKALAVCEYLEGDRRSYCEEVVRFGAYSLERSFDLYFAP